MPVLSRAVGMPLLPPLSLSVLRLGALIYGFVTDDFSMKYVVEVSSAAQPVLYKITALWGAMSGSLLFWLWLLTVGGAIVVWQNYQRNKQTQDTLADYSLIPIAVVQLFFTILVTGLIDGIYNPLARFPGGQVAADGQGMNPLLQTPLMAIHPPTLYIGWISLTIPFAFAVGALASGRIGSGWDTPFAQMDAIFMDYTDHRYHAWW